MYKIIAEDLRMLRSLTSSYNGQRRNTNHASYYVLLLELTRLLRISYKLSAYAFHVRELHLYSSSLILEWYLHDEFRISTTDVKWQICVYILGDKGK